VEHLIASDKEDALQSSPIASVKKHARLIVGVSCATAVLFVNAAAAASSPWHVVASGSLSGHAWTLSGSDVTGERGDHCVKFAIRLGSRIDQFPAGSCALITTAGRNGIHIGGVLGTGPVGLIVFGMVAPSASTVVVKLRGGSSVRAGTYRPPPPLSEAVNYFAVRISLASHLAGVKALDSHGHAVASWTAPAR
jgi:hypothetical protein